MVIYQVCITCEYCISFDVSNGAFNTLWCEFLNYANDNFTCWFIHPISAVDLVKTNCKGLLKSEAFKFLWGKKGYTGCLASVISTHQISVIFIS